MNMSDFKAFITKCSDIHQNINDGLKYINWDKIVANNSTVFIKPNFTYPFYKPGITTSPIILRELLGLIKDRVDRVIVGESDGGNHSFTADQAFKGHNMYDICKETGAELVNLSNIPSKIISDKIQGKKVTVQVPSLLVDEIDCFFSVPVLKVHVMTTTTLSMKNLWGCYPDTMRCLNHKYLSRKLTLLTKILNPKIALIDGIYALNGHGPMYGDPINTNLLIMANNPVVADTLGTSLMGFPIPQIEHIIMAEKEGLGTTNLKNVEFNDDWKKFSMNFNVNKTILDRIAYIPFNSKCAAGLIMDSSLTPIIYSIGTKLRNKKEQLVNAELEKVSN